MKFTYFMIHWGPRVWVFSALHYCCYLGVQASTSLPSSTAQKALTQLVLTQPLFEHRLHARLLNVSRRTVLIGATKPTQLLQKIKIHQPSVTRKKQSRHFQRQREGHLWGSSENGSKVLHIHLKYSHLFVLQV